MYSSVAAMPGLSSIRTVSVTSPPAETSPDDRDTVGVSAARADPHQLIDSMIASKKLPARFKQ
jgi:hypothetical protein